MLWGKKPKQEEEKLRKPQVIPQLVQKQMVAEWKLSPELVPLLKALIRKRATGESAFDIRVFDESDALAKKVRVNDYTSLDKEPGLILYEGCFDEASKQVELQEKQRVDWDIHIFTEAEILQKIETLNVPGNSVFFYQARGSNHGGPLGMGATVIELNPNYPEKGKKYNIYTGDVVDMQPVRKEQKSFDSNKPKEIARWVKDAHHKRMY